MKQARVRSSRSFLALLATSLLLSAVAAGTAAPSSVGALITTDPSNVVGSFNNGAIDVTWDAAVSDAAGLNYRVTLLDSDGNPVGAPGDVTTLSHSFSPGIPGPFTATVVANDDDAVASSAIASAAILTAPGAPTGVAATESGPTAASVSFAAPASDGGSAVTSYTVTASPGGANATNGTSPIVVPDLAPGTSYTFTVTATNAVDTGPASQPSNEVTIPPPASAPGAPTGVTAALSGTTGASVSFAAPASDGGSTVTSYRVTASPGGTTATGSSSPVAVSGLAPGTSYTFEVTATNDVATGPASAPSNAITTPGSPAAPSGVTATLASATSARVSFTPPTANGSTITGYEVTASPGGASQTGIESPLEVPGLTPGVTYTFTVRATNSVGTSGSSAASSGLRIPTTPSQPLNVNAVPVTVFGPMVTVSWTEPSDDGGASLRRYEVSFAGQNATVEAPATSVVFTGVTPGSHEAEVLAVNDRDLTGPVGSTATPAEVRAFAPFNSEAAFVSQQYQDFLGRTAEAAGLAYWQTLTDDSRANVDQIVESFMKAPEFAPRRSVVRLYLAYFDRQPDLAGFDYWSTRLADRSATIDTVSQDFASSQEFQEKYGSLSDAEFVALVYNNVLVRTPDQAGYEYWLGQMANGMSRGRVMAEFSESPEFVAATKPAVDVTVTYRGMLNRRYDQQGFRFWVARIASDQNSLRTLIAGFYNSPEYASRVTP